MTLYTQAQLFFQHQATATPRKTAVQSQTNGAALQNQTKPLITSAHGVHVVSDGVYLF